MKSQVIIDRETGIIVYRNTDKNRMWKVWNEMKVRRSLSWYEFNEDLTISISCALTKQQVKQMPCKGKGKGGKKGKQLPFDVPISILLYDLGTSTS